jgi:hypothetical protein
LPLLELVQYAKASIDDLMSDAARAFVEQLLVSSAQSRQSGNSGRVRVLAVLYTDTVYRRIATPDSPQPIESDHDIEAAFRAMWKKWCN